MSTTMLTRTLNSTRMVLCLTKSWVDKPKRADLEYIVMFFTQNMLILGTLRKTKVDILIEIYCAC